MSGIFWLIVGYYIYTKWAKRWEKVHGTKPSPWRLLAGLINPGFVVISKKDEQPAQNTAVLPRSTHTPAPKTKSGPAGTLHHANHTTAPHQPSRKKSEQQFREL